MINEIKTYSKIETENFAKKFASNLKGNEVIALFGEMGSGKTAFVIGFADFWNLKYYVSSPTFTIMNEYSNKNIKINHFDMYRIENCSDLESTGFFESLENGITIVEWSENVVEFLPKNYIKITFKKSGENERILKIENISS